MAEERFGASFTINVNDLKAGLKTANKLIRESQSEFKLAAAGLDDWTKSEAGLSAKIKSLNQITDVQEKKVEALRQRYKDLIAGGMDPMSDQAIQLRTQIKNEEAALESNRAEIKRDTDALNRLRVEEVTAGKSIDDTSKSAKNSTGSFTVMKGALADLAASGFRLAIAGARKLVSAFTDLGEQADQLDTLAQQSGFTTTELQKFEYASELVDVASSDILGAVKKLKKNVGSDSAATVEAFQSIGVSVRDDVSGELRNINDIFYDVLAGLGAIENETERDTIAMQLFGKNADTLAGIIDDGGKALKEYGKEAEDLGIIMSEDTVQAAAKFDDSIKKIKGTAQGAFYTIGAEIAKAFTPEVDNVRAAIQKLAADGKIKEFAKGAVDAFKNIYNIAKDVGGKVLPLVAKLLGFVAKNFKTLATVTLAAVTAFKAFKAIMAVTTAVQAARTAISGLSAGVSIATKAQYGWNAAMEANPIGAVITAVALLAGGIALLVNTIKGEEVEIESLSQSQRDAAAAAKEVTDAFMEQRQATDDLVTAQTANVNYLTTSLLPELENLVGANGAVKEGEEARAQFILGQLNQALGTEYTSLSQIVDANGKIKDSIYETIEAKKAQILLQAYEEDYAEALKGVTEAQKEQAIAAYDLGKVQEWYDQAVANGDTATAETLKANLEEKQKAYLEATAKADEYYSTITNYEAASQAAIEGNTSEVVRLLDNFSNQFVTTTDLVGKSEQETAAILERQAANAVMAYNLLVEKNKKSWNTMTDDQKTSATNMENDAKGRADAAIAEWEKLGINTIEGWRIGAEYQSRFLDATMVKIVNNALKAAKRAEESHSPSKLFAREVGAPISQGIAVGITKSTGTVTAAVAKQVSAIEQAYDIGELVPNVQAGLSVSGAGAGAAGAAGGRSVVVNQVNNYSQAHSRYEIYKSKQQTAAAVRLAMGAAG